MSIAALQAPRHARVENCSLGSLQAELLSTSQLLRAKLVSFSRILPTTCFQISCHPCVYPSFLSV